MGRGARFTWKQREGNEYMNLKSKIGQWDKGTRKVINSCGNYVQKQFPDNISNSDCIHFITGHTSWLAILQQMREKGEFS